MESSGTKCFMNRSIVCIASGKTVMQGNNIRLVFQVFFLNTIDIY